jgi:uncharacterized membrane protein (DUF2068 family)
MGATVVHQSERASFRRAATREPIGLQVIGAFKLVGGLLAFAAGIGLFRLFRHDVAASLEHAVALLRLDPQNHFIHTAISFASGIDRKHLRALEAGTFFYALLHTIEGIGLLLRRRWAEYLTVVATSSLVPLEGYEILRRFHPIKLVVLVINVGIVIYLIWRLRQDRRGGRQWPMTDDS